MWLGLWKVRFVFFSRIIVNANSGDNSRVSTHISIFDLQLFANSKPKIQTTLLINME